MHRLKRARPVFNIFAVPTSLSLRRLRASLYFSYSRSITTQTPAPQPPRRAFSIAAHPYSDLFDYTSGRWIYNDVPRRAERRRVFNVDGLRQLAAESVDRSPDDILEVKKLAEGGFNRTFLITMHDGFRMVARIPYQLTEPKYHLVASEVATIDFLRSSGLPIPEIYGYSPIADNAAETEYIFMEFIQGTNLSDTWYDLEEGDIISITRQINELESKMMSITFPAGGSLYYRKDMEKVSGSLGILLKDDRFCVGPDLRIPMWFGRRLNLDVDRGPYKSVEAVLIEGAKKELAYMERFGQPLLPLNRMRREAFQYQKQLPSDHIKNLERYLLITSSLIPKDPTLSQFGIRHPDIQPSNIIVSRSPNSNLKIVGLVDWQHTSILPIFLLAYIPLSLQNYHDPISSSMTPPSLPENFDGLNENQQSREKERYRRRLVHYHYCKNMKEHNKLHYAAGTEPMSRLRGRLFAMASLAWEGEILDLKYELIRATESWKTLSGGDSTCPFVFDSEDIDETKRLVAEQREAMELLETSQQIVGCGEDGWVPAENYEEAMKIAKHMKEYSLAAADSEKERNEIAEHWVFDDMDEADYM